MDFILTLLIGGYFAAKSISEKSAIKRYEKKVAEGEKKAEPFLEEYCVSDEIYYETVRRVRARSMKSICELESKLTTIMGAKPTNQMLVWGYLATRGYIPNKFTVTTYTYDNIFTNEHDLIWFRFDRRPNELRKAKIKYLKWYDETLRRNGMEYDLMYCDPYDHKYCKYFYKVEDAKWIGLCENIYPTAIFWEPISHYTPNLIQGGNH